VGGQTVPGAAPRCSGRPRRRTDAGRLRGPRGEPTVVCGGTGPGFTPQGAGRREGRIRAPRARRRAPPGEDGLPKRFALPAPVLVSTEDSRRSAAAQRAMDDAGIARHRTPCKPTPSARKTGLLHGDDGPGRPATAPAEGFLLRVCVYAASPLAITYQARPAGQRFKAGRSTQSPTGRDPQTRPLTQRISQTR